MRFTTLAAIVVCAVTAGVAAGADSRAKTRSKSTAAASSITVSGCLERDDDVYKLTETSGAQAPKQRSWKTGFVRKRNADLGIVDASRKLKLKDHVGHRVSLTGSVKDGEMRASSLRHLAASCGH